jgi:hypothetical protein
MEFKEIDNLIKNRITNKWSTTERRDYVKLEKKYAKHLNGEKPDLYKGYGDKNGLMFLTVVAYDLYIDINITDKVKMVFRKDDSVLITKFSDFNNVELNLDIFITLVEEYIEVTKRFNKFSRGIIPEDLIRNRKINQILDEQKCN